MVDTEHLDLGVLQEAVPALPHAAHFLEVPGKPAGNNQAAEIIRETIHPEANVIFGAVIDENMGDEVRITVIATNFDQAQLHRHMMQSSDSGLFETAARQVRNAERQSKLAQPAARVEPPVAEEPLRFTPGNLEVPAFLRRK